ncbi:hypothetical protein K9857_04820 [Pseudomonas sp. REP124]|uniref:hypothetical protein n=1 Tax=Pseudomonas sp. REP124 TaxID=2875731 RepID=UPI001CCF88EC|nr:hypothetical protein [Pseudomonas sp. REP124]MBZ9780874.1 hypothetical protein [Pseudomonas sp. REP124]
MSFKTVVVALSGTAGVISAGLWIWSARAHVPYESRTNPDGSPVGVLSDGKTDFISTWNKQSQLSAWAAIAASCAAGLQAISLFLND